MSIDDTAKTIVTADPAAILSPVPALSTVGAAASGATGGLDSLKKTLQEKMNKKMAEENDPTDDDKEYLYELVSQAISAGAEVEKLKLADFMQYFVNAKKLQTKKYTAAKVASFFTGTSFMMIIYLVLDKVFTG